MFRTLVANNFTNTSAVVARVPRATAASWLPVILKVIVKVFAEVFVKVSVTSIRKKHKTIDIIYLYYTLLLILLLYIFEN